MFEPVEPEDTPVLDTSQWPEMKLNVLKEIYLDPMNVRLEIADAKVEADIIEDLFVNEGALKLVEGICTVGYLTHETPVVLKRRGKYVMVEGNRRLAALKAIQNPMLVPDYQARVAAFAAQLPDRSVLSRIRVMIAPSQTAADQLVAAIHTGNLRKPWTPSRQAAFFQAQIDAGRTLRELLARYPTIDVRKFVFRAHVINLFKLVNYDDPELRDYLQTKQWAQGLSTLARIYESKAFSELTGLAMQPDGSITKVVSDSVFKELATEIVRGMLAGNINTRSLNSITSPRFARLIAELNHIIADAGDTRSGSKTSEPLGFGHSDESRYESAEGGESRDPTAGIPSLSHVQSGSTGNEGLTSGAASTPTRLPSARKKKQRNLDLSQVRVPDQYPEALKVLMGELSEIDVQRFPNGTFLMMRATLEKAIKSYAEARQVDIKASGYNQKGRVQLGNALEWLSEHVKADGPPYLRQVIEGVKTGKLVVYTNSSDSLNAINHNHHFKVDADQAIAMWSSIDSIMRYLMKP